MSRLGQIHEDYLDPDRHLGELEEDNTENCARCNTDLHDPQRSMGPGTDCHEQGFCSTICEALYFRDWMIKQGWYSSEQGFRSDFTLLINRYRAGKINLEDSA